MMNNNELSGFLTMVYMGFERMNAEQRRIVLRHLKEARRMCDFTYPQGKPDLIKPTEEEKNAILRPNA